MRYSFERTLQDICLTRDYFQPRAPFYVRVVLTGLDPYVGVYDHIVESMDQFGGQNLAKLASNYAHRLKSSFWATSSSWLYGDQASEYFL